MLPIAISIKFVETNVLRQDLIAVVRPAARINMHAAQLGAISIKETDVYTRLVRIVLVLPGIDNLEQNVRFSGVRTTKQRQHR